MAKQTGIKLAVPITLKEALELVEFWRDSLGGNWHVRAVKGDCYTVEGEVHGTINGRQWQYVETPKQRLGRLIEDGATKEQLLEAFNQLEDN